MEFFKGKSRSKSNTKIGFGLLFARNDYHFLMKNLFTILILFPVASVISWFKENLFNFGLINFNIFNETLLSLITFVPFWEVSITVNNRFSLYFSIEWKNSPDYENNYSN